MRRRRFNQIEFSTLIYAPLGALVSRRPRGDCHAGDAGAAATARHLRDAPASLKRARGSRQKNSVATAMLFCWGTPSPPPEQSGGNLAFARKRGSRRFYRWGADDLHPSAKSSDAAPAAAFRAIRAVELAFVFVFTPVFGLDKSQHKFAHI